MAQVTTSTIYTSLYRNKEPLVGDTAIGLEPNGERVTCAVYQAFWLVTDITDPQQHSVKCGLTCNHIS